MPEPLAKPFGNSLLFEFIKIRELSQALAARITVLPRTILCSRVRLSTYNTPIALPLPLVSTSRAMAISSTVHRPVFMAGNTCTWLELYAEAVWQPRPHWPQ